MTCSVVSGLSAKTQASPEEEEEKKPQEWGSAHVQRQARMCGQRPEPGAGGGEGLSPPQGVQKGLERNPGAGMDREQTAPVKLLASPHSSCVTVENLLTCSVPQFPPL